MKPQDKYVYNPSVEECKAIFVASCIETTAKATGMAPEAMYQRMLRIGLINDYILPCYNVLHAFYTSKTCRELHDSDLGLYLLGDNCIVDEVIAELRISPR